MVGNGLQDPGRMHRLITESLIQLNKGAGLMKTAITFADMFQNLLTYLPLKFMSLGYFLMDIARVTPNASLITRLSV